MYQNLISKFVDDEIDRHRGYVVVAYNIMILWLFDNNLVIFFEELTVNNI